MRLPGSPTLSDLEEIYSGMSPYLEALRDARLLVAGGTGTVGTWLLFALLHLDTRAGLGLRITVLSRNPEAFKARFPLLSRDDRLEWLRGDARTVALPTRSRFSHVIHGATDVVSPAGAAEILDVCVSATRHLLEIARQTDATRFLLLSSGAVYGKAPNIPDGIPETYLGPLSPLDPNTAYAQGKRCAELLCAIGAQQGGLTVSIARCFAMVGPYLPLDKHFAIGNFIHDALRQVPIVIRGDGTPVRSYLYLGDVTRQLLTLLVAGEAAVPYNIGGLEALSISDLARRVLSTLQVDVQIITERTSAGVAHADVYHPNTQRIREAFSMQDDVPLSEAILRTASWYRESIMGSH